MDRIAFIIGESFIFWSPIILALAALAASCLFIGFYLSRSCNGIGTFMAVPLAFVFSMALARLIHWYCRTDSYPSFEAAMTDYTSGGYALLGVVAGCILAACLLRIIQVVKNLPEMLDCMALAGAAGICIGRCNSFFNSSDRGDILENITQLPLVYPVTNAVTGGVENRLATFVLQSAYAGVVFAVLLLFWLLMKRKGKSGDTALMFALLYGASQAVFDSTRYDSLYLRSNGFVSLVQIAGAIGVVLAVVWFSVRMCKSRRWHWGYLALWIPILALLGGAGYMEYHVQRHGDQALFAYTIMSGCLIGVILLGIVIYILAVTGECRNAKRAKLEAQLLEQAVEAPQEEAPAEEAKEEVKEEIAEEVATQ